jgi:EAL domain-containing protein (putative c-di-GMP-specific phosphodiesterase class I)
VLTATGIDPHQLTIEITETVLLDDLTLVATQLDELRRLGAQIAIDDFGTGYTSLAHLHCLPVDTIKIDRGFIAGMGDPKDAALVRMIMEPWAPTISKVFLLLALCPPRTFPPGP